MHHTSSHTRISSVLLWCWFTRIVCIRAFSIAMTRELHHNAKVCASQEPGRVATPQHRADRRNESHEGEKGKVSHDFFSIHPVEVMHHTSSHTRISSVLLWCWFMHTVYIRAFSTAITQGLHHNAKVCGPVRGCDSDFRDVRTVCSRGVMSDFHSVLRSSHTNSFSARIELQTNGCCSCLGVDHVAFAKIQRLQNAAARIVTLTRKYTHITPILKSLHWLPIEQHIKFKILLSVFHCVQGSAPQYNLSLISVYNPVRSLRSANSGFLVVPGCYKSWGEWAFARAGPWLWNSLPPHLRNMSSKESFKVELETYLFHEF